MKPQFFETLNGQKYKFPMFFPDATRAVVKSLDMSDVENTNTLGILVNTLHLHMSPGADVIKKQGGVSQFMNWHGATISDSGGFQVMSIAKSIGGKVTDEGVTFQMPNKPKSKLTPELSIKIQLALKTDLMVVLDDFTPPGASYEYAKETVERTIMWAKRCKKYFDDNVSKTGKRPYLIGVVQGGDHLDLRADCTKALVDIGFDGLGYGGWPIQETGEFNYDVPAVIRKNTPDDYILYGLGVGKPHEIVRLVKEGWHVFDCVLPTRDARHKRLYVYNAKTINDINIEDEKFYSYYTPDKEKYYRDNSPVSTACDCLLCTRYSKSYLSHLFRVGDMTAGRLATIHNLRFYSILMDKLI
jgi:queuine tRNA-ribosyltransferase